jgi:lipoyl-dependent peroxiredoxin
LLHDGAVGAAWKRRTGGRQVGTTATLTFEKLEAGWTVTQVHLDVKGKVPKADQAAWEKATASAKAGCPISRLLNTTITMEAKLEG